VEYAQGDTMGERQSDTNPIQLDLHSRHSSPGRSDSQTMQSPKNVVRALLVFLVASVCFLNYWQYNRQFQSEPDQYVGLINGTADAPQQYRVLIVRSAWFITQHVHHLGLRHAFGAFDMLAALISGWLLLLLIERSEAFQKRPAMEQWLAYAVFLFLIAYYLIWVDWYQRPETLPTACFVAIMLALLSWKPANSASLAAIAIGTLAIVLLQGLTRADVAFCFYLGVFIYACLPNNNPLPGPRYFHAALAAVAALFAVAIQWVMMHRVYPNATYGDTKVVQLKGNFTDPLSVLPFLLFVLPAAWTCWFVFRRRPATEAPWLALLLAAVVFVPLWSVVGRIQEARIFLPFAMALIPLTVACCLEGISHLNLKTINERR
jgi:branched-subunit amino acid transport protein AzlD